MNATVRPDAGIEVEDFPAFIVVDDKGNDFFTALREGREALTVIS